MPEAFEPTDDRPKSARDGRHRAVTTAVLGLAVGKPVALVAKEAGVSVRTLHRWSARPEFRSRVTKVRGQLLDRALGRASAALAASFEVMARLLKAEDADLRLRAARSVVELTLKVREHAELEQRLAELEQRLAEQVGDRGT
jgi:hypothetical protein